MSDLPQYFQINSDGKAQGAAIIQGKDYRFTLLTESLIRMEYNKDGKFEDNLTQIVINRNFPVPKYKVFERDGNLYIQTNAFELIYRKGQFNENTLEITKSGAFSNHDCTWRYGQSVSTLKGTCRTLDQTWGEVPLEEGLMAKIGYSILDDSQSAIIGNDGIMYPRDEGAIDLYYFGYGHDYQLCLKDYYCLTGKTPMLPRYALGNWWSRYYPYEQDEYVALMEKFENLNIPFSVAVLDMDWHITKVDSKYGRGWTGYTWNETLFPDHKGMIEWLHDHNMRVTLNLHPADGVKGYEKQYAVMAEKLGINPETEQPIPFDFGNVEFIKAYFEYLHHPLEQEGVDFWWIDWQSGGVSAIKGMDPLWLLNHYHMLDINRNKKEGIILSRYAGPGSHRYPIGFSGDTRMTWSNLAFQPYFTATASNIGYTWWSHDIGGHARGCKDDELMIRWVQFGVFSPINRLHSNACEFNGKEPWNYKTCDLICKFLRLRHQLIPYLFTMNYLTSEEGQPLIRPMYYTHSEKENAYLVPNHYWFGSEMIVAPITQKSNATYFRAGVNVWLPEGRWVDVFTGHIYTGERMIKMYRTTESIPVLAKAGAIIPLDKGDGDWKCIDNPVNIQISVYGGADNTFSLYEEKDEKHSFTDFKLSWNNDQSAIFEIEPVRGSKSVIPRIRNYTISLCGFSDDCQVFLERNGVRESLDFVKKNHNIISVLVKDVKQEDYIKIVILGKDLLCKNDNYIQNCKEFLMEIQTDILQKVRVMEVLNNNKKDINLIAELNSICLPEEYMSILLDLLTD